MSGVERIIERTSLVVQIPCAHRECERVLAIVAIVCRADPLGLATDLPTEVLHDELANRQTDAKLLNVLCVCRLEELVQTGRVLVRGFGLNHLNEKLLIVGIIKHSQTNFVQSCPLHRVFDQVDNRLFKAVFVAVEFLWDALVKPAHKVVAE